MQLPDALIMRPFGRGLRNREIAEQLGVTEGTVKVYLHAIFEKLGVNSRTELAIRADEEQAAAECARDPRARQTHLDLAERYLNAAGSAAHMPVRHDPAEIGGSSLLRPEFRILN